MWGSKLIYSSPVAQSGPPDRPGHALSAFNGLMEFYRFEDMNLQSAIDQSSQSVTSHIPITHEGELNSIVFAIWVRLGDADGRSNRTTDELVSDTPDLARMVGNSKGGAHFNSAQGYAQCARNWLTPTLMLDPYEHANATSSQCIAKWTPPA